MPDGVNLGLLNGLGVNVRFDFLVLYTMVFTKQFILSDIANI